MKKFIKFKEKGIHCNMTSEKHRKLRTSLD